MFQAPCCLVLNQTAILRGAVKLVLFSILLSPMVSAQITKNIITDFKATCNGSVSDARAFANFNSWAVMWQANNPGQLITLFIPAGYNCVPGSWYANGISNLLISGYGAQISTLGGSVPLALGTRHFYNDNLHSARLATVQAGSSTVTLLKPSQTSIFTVGNYAIVTGIDMQGGGSYPPNPAIWQFVVVTSINSADGTVTFNNPLLNTYEASWPLYYAGTRDNVDDGGPATLYALNPGWNVNLEYDGVTIDLATEQSVSGRSITFKDVTVNPGSPDPGGENCVLPSVNMSWTLIGATVHCVSEVDKVIDSVSVTNSTVDQFLVQSASVKSFAVTSSTVTVMNGTPINFYGSNDIFTTFKTAPLGYGGANSVSCYNCVIPSIVAGGVEDGGGSGVNVKYSMLNGVITSPNSNGPVYWAVPGIHMFWYGSTPYEGVPFTVVDLTQDSTNTYIQTSLAGGFPATIPTSAGAIFLRVHPAWQFTCSNCTGGADALDLSGAPPGLPLYSYTSRTYTGNIGQAPLVNIWGSLVSASFDVTTPYAGVQRPLQLDGANVNAINASGTFVGWHPLINLGKAGTRTVSPSAATGAQPGDSLSATGVVTLDVVHPYAGTNIGNESPLIYPTITITIRTNQGQTQDGRTISNVAYGAVTR